MNYDLLNAEPKELMSDSLRDLFDEENSIKQLENNFILVSIEVEDQEEIVGSLVGIELGDNPKLDLKVLTKKAFELINNVLIEKKKIANLYLSHDTNIIKWSGPFNVNYLKIIDIDCERQTSILAIDLSKNEP